MWPLGYSSATIAHFFMSLRGSRALRDRPHILLTQWESRRQSCFKIDLFSGNWVVEFQVLGVQEISSVAGEAGEILKRLAG